MEKNSKKPFFKSFYFKNNKTNNFQKKRDIGLVKSYYEKKLKDQENYYINLIDEIKRKHQEELCECEKRIKDLQEYIKGFHGGLHFIGHGDDVPISCSRYDFMYD